jgi:hypothetical protein
MGILLIILLVLLLPVFFLFVLGNTAKANNNKDRAKVFYILCVVYLIVGLGICGSLLFSF